ncbi:MAG: zf-TFIIB domain-containing protein [Candidatus Cloacimonetes bacterium]|nr:zf-TFIIB domain-containing protein [Candidatus Cloacimonadota bacterium]
MNSLKCPNCNSEMKKVKEQDIIIDRCENCGGIFLDKGELNILATGMSGDIEFCSIDNDFHKDNFGIRKCPKCSDQKMRKINLLSYSNIIFDFCPKCEGFFLDEGELNAMNNELQEIYDSKFPEEYRGNIGKHLVRLDKIVDSNIFSFSSLRHPIANLKYSFFLRLSIYYDQSFDIGLRLYSDKWTGNFLKVIGMLNKQNIQTGIEEFDSIFIIQGREKEKVRNLFRSKKIQKELIDFISDKPQMLSIEGKLEINDKQIIFTEGPYSEEGSYDVENDHQKIVARLIKLASLFEESMKKITFE